MKLRELFKEAKRAVEELEHWKDYLYAEVVRDLARRLKLAEEALSECVGLFDSYAYGINTLENLKDKLLDERDFYRARLREIREPPKQ